MPKRLRVSCSIREARGKIQVWFVWIIAFLLLVSSGITYRVLASMIVDTAINLPISLSEFPTIIGDWSSTELSIPTTTREYMESNFADDFLSRRYINPESQAWADVYIVYCASKPGGMLGHQPEVCYPGNGWIHESTEESQFITRQGQEIACLIHRFHKPAPAYDEIVVLNFYIVNGQLSIDQKGFSGVLSRRYNFARNSARYVAQVQISSLMENSIRKAAEDMTGTILGFLPGADSNVSVPEKYDSGSN
jgi:hypothetical protein